MSKNFEILKGLFGSQITELTEEHRNVLSEKLDNLLEARVDAKVKFQTEVIEEEAKEKYSTLLKEASGKFQNNLKLVEEKTIEKASSYKNNLDKQLKETVQKISQKKKADIATFKKLMVEKLDKYLNYELERRIPNTYVEEAAKAAIFEPMVTGIKKIMEENGIKLDEDNFGLIKDARKEIIKIREELATTVKENMNISEELSGVKRSMKISKVCEGLTDAQRERASKLLEGCDADEVEDRFSAIRDFIIEGYTSKKSTKSSKKRLVTEEELEVEGEEEVEEESGSDALADVGGNVSDVEEAEDEEDIMNVEETEDAPITEQTLIKSWAEEYKRLSGLR